MAASDGRMSGESASRAPVLALVAGWTWLAGLAEWAGGWSVSRIGIAGVLWAMVVLHARDDDWGLWQRLREGLAWGLAGARPLRVALERAQSGGQGWMREQEAHDGPGREACPPLMFPDGAEHRRRGRRRDGPRGCGVGS